VAPEPAPTPELEPDPELDAAIRALTPSERMRDRRIWLWLIIGGLVVLAAFLFAFWPVMQGRLNAAKQLDQAIALLGQAEGTMAGADTAVTTQLSADAQPSAPSVATELLVARRELTQANQLLDDAMPHLTEDEQHRAQLAQTAAKARLAMVDNAPAILVASVKAVQAKALGDRGWALSQHAKADEADAASDYQFQTASKVESAAVAVTTVQIELTDARSLYSQAASAFPTAGFEHYVSYTDVQTASVAQLAQAATLWLHGSQPLAKATFALYQISAAKATAAAKSLPYAPGSATSAAFRKLAGSRVAAYTSAKKQAEDADKALATP
jgi:hypothetical protein